MFRTLLTLTFAVCLVAIVAGCEENEVKITEKKQTQTESTPTDVKPGEMIVE